VENMVLGLTLDPTPALNLIPVIILLIAFLVVVINGISQFFVLTGLQTSIVGFVAFVLVAMSTFLTTVRAN
jgi:hypothetical protein